MFFRIPHTDDHTIPHMIQSGKFCTIIPNYKKEDIKEEEEEEEGGYRGSMGPVVEGHKESSTRAS
ncbi:unnamed protein product [Staurois parvus]|uniref:Uncharacterized protein n=1 Tax=Staurois parvus TaxID=386267 RepID=A0ABN9BPX1_9NEOB|nr:unnamed protein product [Staurois parvus]